jgi:hypothetical protein
MSVRCMLVLAIFMLSLTGAHGESLCFDEAGALYDIHPDILRAIAKVESNYQTRAINWNRNGTYDFGVMQINSSWAYTIGLEQWKTLGDSCSNIKTGAMILAGCMKKYGYTWDAIGCYNSQTPDKRDKYALLVYRQLKNIERDALAGKAAPAVGRGDADGGVATVRSGIGEDHRSSSPAPQAPSAMDQASAPESAGIALNSASPFREGARGL